MMIEQWNRLLGGMKFTMDLNNIKKMKTIIRAHFVRHFIQILTIIDSDFFIIHSFNSILARNFAFAYSFVSSSMFCSVHSEQVMNKWKEKNSLLFIGIVMQDNHRATHITIH